MLVSSAATILGTDILNQDVPRAWYEDVPEPGLAEVQHPVSAQGTLVLLHMNEQKERDSIHPKE